MGYAGVGYYGAGTFNQTGGSNVVGYLTIGNGGRYQFSGGTLQVIGGVNRASSTSAGSTGMLMIAGSPIVDFSGTAFVNTGSMSLSVGPNSLLLLPAGFDPAAAFASYTYAGLTHNVGTPLTILPGQGFSGNGSLADFVNCQGTIAATIGGAINLNGGIAVSAPGNVSLGSGNCTVNDSQSGMNGGSLSVNYFTIGSAGRFQFSGGTLHVNGFANQGVFDPTGSTGALTVAGSSIVDFSQAALLNSMSLSIGPNSLLLLPAGFNPATGFSSFSNAGLTHNVGTPLTILPGQGFSGIGAVADFVNCQGTIAATTGGAINLNGGLTVSGTGNVSLGYGVLTVKDSLSGITAGSLSAYFENVGSPGTGTFTQSGGTNNLGYGMLLLGYNSGSSGSYILSGSGLLSAYTEYVGSSGTGTFNQTGGLNSVTYLGIGNLARYQFSSGTLQANGFSNLGVFDATGSTGVLTVAGSSIVDFSQAMLLNTGSMSLAIGPNSLLLLPAGFDPATGLGVSATLA